MIRIARFRSRLFAAIARLAAAVVGGLALAGAAFADPPIWHVQEAGGGHITLFGSVHLLSDATRWRNPALDADLAGSSAIWFEIPFDAASQAEAGKLALQKGLLPAGQTLDQGAYAGLAQQNTVAQPFTYRAVAPDLFQAILSRQAAPGPGPADGRGGAGVSPRSPNSNDGKSNAG